MLPDSTDLFVIGGGPAGLAAAIAARRRGFEVTVADCARPPIDKACGEGIMPDGLAAARALGIELEGAGQPFRGIRFCHGGERVEADFPVGRGIGMRRTALHRILIEHAERAGVRLAWGARIAGIGAGIGEGIGEGCVYAEGRAIGAKWIAGADGGHSVVRRWAGLDGTLRARPWNRRPPRRRYGFRRHYRVAPWSEFMEIHWGDGCQLYITPVGPFEICVVLISADERLRLDEALPRFPEVARRLGGAGGPGGPATPERGGLSVSRRLPRVTRGCVALVGDASGSVDAITGEGLCLLFQQAEALAGALEAGGLARYETEHRRIGKRPERMAELMLLLDRRGALWSRFRSRALRSLAAHPRWFAGMLALHVGEGLPLGCRLLTL